MADQSPDTEEAHWKPPSGAHTRDVKAEVLAALDRLGLAYAPEFVRISKITRRSALLGEASKLPLSTQL